MSIIERIFYLMEQQKIKSSELATFLGVNKSVVSTWKKRNTNPPSEMLVKICELLNVSINFLLTGEDAKKDNELNDEETYIITLYRQLNERNRIKLEGYIEAELLRQRENINKKSSFELQENIIQKEKKELITK
ncbi:helix-turn-helix domain-containing protein [Peptoanaerobacter stomatis]|uniref:helix-turn-helix domain-containing protein n=1 Tax=Peptoanaerobacter stomatis TaxID=796937 RepID=UPI003F9F0890